MNFWKKQTRIFYNERWPATNSAQIEDSTSHPEKSMRTERQALRVKQKKNIKKK